MRLVKSDIRKIEKTNFSRTKNLEILEEFVESDMDCAEVKDFTQITAMSCATSLNNSIKRFNIGGIKAISREGKCYLIKKKQ